MCIDTVGCICYMHVSVPWANQFPLEGYKVKKVEYTINNTAWGRNRNI